MNSFRISAPARIHMNLLSMGRDGYRKNGGIGFSISGCDTIFEFSPSDLNLVSDTRLHALDAGAINKLIMHLELLCSELKFKKKLKVSILDGPKPHSGLGVGTTTKLALTEALMLANEYTLLPEDLVRFSRRGGTSGIGVNTYFYGGFILDGGVPMDDEPFGPSSSKEASSFTLPRLMIRTSIPQNWSFGLLQIPADAISGERERKFFQDHTPINRRAIESACYEAVMGATASVLDGDYETFSVAVNAIQSQVWKAAEWDAQSDKVKSARHWLSSRGVASIGLSSFGPAIYFMCRDFAGREEYSDIPAGWDLRFVMPNNFGRKVEYV